MTPPLRSAALLSEEGAKGPAAAGREGPAVGFALRWRRWSAARVWARPGGPPAWPRHFDTIAGRPGDFRGPAPARASFQGATSPVTPGSLSVPYRTRG